MDLVSGRLHRHSDPHRLFFFIPNTVRDEILQDALQKERISCHHRHLFAVNVEICPLLFPKDPILIDEIRNQPRKVERYKRQRLLPQIHFRQKQQLIDQTSQDLRFLLDHAQIMLLLLRRIRHMVEKPFYIGADRRQRCTDIMRDAGDELLPSRLILFPLPKRRGELLRHQIERRQRRCKFILPLMGQMDGKISLLHLVGPSLQLLQRCQDPPDNEPRQPIGN